MIPSKVIDEFLVPPGKSILLERLDRPEKQWKFCSADLAERGFWDQYMRAYELALSATSTKWAPWYVIPADHKWFARIGAAAVIANALIEIDPQFPVLDARARGDLQAVKAELEGEAPEGAAADPFQEELDAQS